MREIRATVARIVKRFADLSIVREPRSLRVIANLSAIADARGASRD
jgi:hypothetical protein